MPAELVPTSVQSDGKYRLTIVPTGSNALSVAILNGATAKPVTYGLTADGYNHTVAQVPVVDKRLTLIQDLARPGKVAETLEIKGVSSVTPDSADVIFTGLSASGAESQLTVRRAVDNATNHVLAQLADVVTFVAGVRRPDAPTENSVDTWSMTLYITKPTVRQASLIA